MSNDFKIKNGSGRICCKGCGRQDRQLNTYDWMADVPGNADEQDMVEVQFKNTRKGYYKNSNKLKIEKGDVVAVESSPGHDIGVVTLTGRLVPLQMKKANLKPDAEIRRVYRKAKPVDLEKYEEAKAKEHETMIRSRQIALDLRLNMKIGDVEYQGDGNKAIFYYIADERVDFRQLIKVLAENFRVRIEMKQIGARQEAGRIGGIGPCGRELCCSTWMTSFNSVSTSAARYQDISLNPQKLAGQCAKLKCCMNYEVDVYVEAQKRFPSKEVTLETQDGTYYFFKADILKGTILYSSDKHFMSNVVTITTKRAFDIINMNRRGEKPEALAEKGKQTEPQKPVDLVEQESLTRFDKAKSANKKKKKRPMAQGENRSTEREEGRAPRERREGERSSQEARGEGRGRREGEQSNQHPRRREDARRTNGNRPERAGEGQEKRVREQGERNQEQGERSRENRNRPERTAEGQPKRVREQGERSQEQGERSRENKNRSERTGEGQPKRGREQGERNQEQGEKSRENRNRSNEREEGRAPRERREGERPPRREGGERRNPRKEGEVKEGFKAPRSDEEGREANRAPRERRDQERPTKPRTEEGGTSTNNAKKNEAAQSE